MFDQRSVRKGGYLRKKTLKKLGVKNIDASVKVKYEYAVYVYIRYML